MPSNIDYALMAANAYAVKDDVTSDKNAIPVPDSWNIFDFRIDDPTGFTARAYRNDVTREIVIAYTGTTFESLNNDIGDWFLGNLPAGSGGALAPQVTDAARFYLDTLKSNPNTTITFTGHSLGGGLASMMAVFFNRNAVVFDEAPFKKSADSFIVVNALKQTLKQEGYTLPDAFADYIAIDPFAGVLLPSPTRSARERMVSAIYVMDEILSLAQTTQGKAALIGLGLLTNPIVLALAANVANIAGQTRALDGKATTGNGWGYPIVNGNPVDLHSMPLLASFLMSGDFLTASKATPELLQKIFTSPLNYEPKSSDINFLNLMVQRQTFEGEDPLGALARDIIRLRTPTLEGTELKLTLVDLALRLQYAQGIAHNIGMESGEFKAVFDPLGGGIQITRKPEDEKWTRDGFIKLEASLKSVFPDIDKESLEGIERYSIPTALSLSANTPDDELKDLMVGGLGGDSLSGGGGNDLIFGGSGADTLKGGAGEDKLYGGSGNDLLEGGQGNDTLNGGKGYDTYIWNSGDGADKISDSDGQGHIEIRQADGSTQILGGQLIKEESGNTWKSVDGQLTLSSGAGWTLTTESGATLTLDQYKDGDYGLYLNGTPAKIKPTSQTLLGDKKPQDQSGEDGYQYHYDSDGNLVVSEDDEADRRDILYGNYDRNDRIEGRGGNDFIDTDEQGAGNASDDLALGGAGDDILWGNEGRDKLEGGADKDWLDGGPGDDNLYADKETKLADALTQQGTGGKPGDWLNGNDGDDTLIGDKHDDLLMGGPGRDILAGGAGNDTLYGGWGIDYAAVRSYRPENSQEPDKPSPFPELQWSIKRKVKNGDTYETTFEITKHTSFTALSFYQDKDDTKGDALYGGAGDDWIMAGEGDDYAEGGDGDDILNGGKGKDVVAENDGQWALVA